MVWTKVKNADSLPTLELMKNLGPGPTKNQQQFFFILLLKTQPLNIIHESPCSCLPDPHLPTTSLIPSFPHSLSRSFQAAEYQAVRYYNCRLSPLTETRLCKCDFSPPLLSVGFRAVCVVAGLDQCGFPLTVLHVNVTSLSPPPSFLEERGQHWTCTE